MNGTDTYFIAFRLGILVQLVLLPLIAFEPTIGLALSLLNALAIAFFYPMFLLWLDDRTWARIPPKLGPHQ